MSQRLIRSVVFPGLGDADVLSRKLLNKFGGAKAHELLKIPIQVGLIVITVHEN